MTGNGRAEVKSGSRNWHELFERNTGRLFFLALLITGDVATAESVLVASMDLLAADPPAGSAAGWEEIERTVMRSSLVVAQQMRDSSIEALPPLPAEVQAVLRLDADLRCCFVLRLVARYSNRDCAAMLNLGSDDVEALVQTALIRLSSASWSASDAEAAEAR